MFDQMPATTSHDVFPAGTTELAHPGKAALPPGCFSFVQWPKMGRPNVRFYE